MHAGRPTHAQLATQRMTTDNNRRRRQTEKAQTFNPVSFVKLTRREKKNRYAPRSTALLYPFAADARTHTHRHTHTRTHAHRSAYFCVHSTRVGHFRVRLKHKCTTGALAHTHKYTHIYKVVRVSRRSTLKVDTAHRSTPALASSYSISTHRRTRTYNTGNATDYIRT